MNLRIPACVVPALAMALTSLGSPREDFGDAKWMWPRELGAVTNTTVEFRRTFVAGSPSSLELAIAADTVYAVELNGEFVRSGRFPDVPPQRYYDVLPLGNVRKGENEIRISLYVQGIDTFQTLPGDPGLLFALKGADVAVRSGADVEWRVSTRDRREGVPLVTSQLGFAFEYDANRPESAWRRVGAGDAVRGVDDFLLERRPVPPVEILPEVSATVVAQGRLDGSPAPDDVSPGMDATRMTPSPAAAFFLGDGKGVRPDFFRDGFYVLVDLGREEAGFLSLDVDTDAGAVIDIGHAEHAEDGRIRTHIGTRNFAGRYRARDGRQRYFRWARRMAGRYIQLHVRGVRTHFTLNGVTVRPAVFPVTERPVPANLSVRQRRIWETAVRTLRLCMHEHYEDCPWREQALYCNDARNQMLCGYFAFGEGNRMPELALRVHARGLDENAWLELCMPAKIRITIPSFTFCWALAVGDNLRYRRDAAFTKSLMPTMRRILDRRLSELEGGLLPCPRGKRYWQFYEWAKDLSGDLSGATAVRADEARFESPLNLFLVLALESGADCADATGDAGSAVRWREAAGRLRAEIRRRFWNPAGGYMGTRLGAALQPAELVQSLALLADAVPSAARAGVVRKLSGPSDWTEVTLSQTLYKYEALIAAGGTAAAAAIRSMDAEWARMLDAGATSFWEMREGWPAFGNAGSLCHGWSAVPVYIYGAHPELIRGGNAGTPCPWVSDEEREAVRNRVCALETQPGTPESDAKRFYTNPEKTECVEFNYDESKSGEGTYTLEDPLAFADGRKVGNAADWRLRRREILGIFEREVYGRLPPKPAEMTFDLVSERVSEDRFATIRTYRQYFRADRTGPVIDWIAIVPRHAKGPSPVFLHLNYAGLEQIAAKKTNHYDLPWDQLVANGYAFMSARYDQITSDLRHGDTVTNAFNGVCELWGRRDPKATDNPGALIVWAWGLMRGLDLAERIPGIDATRNVVIGSSRLGKAALLAAAFDERFTVCIPNQTGAVGVQLMKRDYGESLKGQHLSLPHWYCGAVWKYEDDPRSMPFDQHLLLACIAPRNLLLECYHKKWFDPYGEFLSAKAAAPVWKFLAGRTFEAAELPAAYDETYLKPPFGYVTRTECHGLSPYDWAWAIRFANEALGKER